MRFVEESPTLFSSSFFSFLQKLIHIKPYTRTFRNNGHCPAVPVIMWRFSKGSPSPWNYCLARFLKLYPILCVDLEAINRYPEVLGDDGERQTDLWKRGKSFDLHIVGGWTDEVCIDCVITGWNLLYSLEESKGLHEFSKKGRANGFRLTRAKVKFHLGEPRVRFWRMVREWNKSSVLNSENYSTVV